MKMFVKVAGAFAVALALALGSTSAFAASPIVEDGPSDIVVRVKGPGHPVVWDIQARNTSPAAISPTFRITEAGGALFEGPHPAQISLQHGATVLYSGDAAGLVGEVFPLNDVGANAGVRLTATVLLPYEAGDEYRTADGTVAWEFSAFGGADPVSPPPQGSLAVTGAGATAALLVAAAAALLGSLLFLVSRRRRSAETER